MELVHYYCLDITKLHNCFCLLWILKHYVSWGAVGRNQIKKCCCWWIITGNTLSELNFPFSKTFSFLTWENRGPLRALVCKALWTSARAASRGRLCPAVRAGGTGTPGCWRKHALARELPLSCRSVWVRPALGSKNNHMNTTNSSICLNRPLPATGPGSLLTLQDTVYGGAVKLNVLA